MKARTWLSLCLCLAGGASGLSASEAGGPPGLARSLQRLQDQIVRGHQAAIAQQQPILSQLAQEFGAVPRDQWQNAANARAVVIYLVSGGRPPAVRSLLSSGVNFGASQELVVALLAFAERKREAMDKLAKFDAMGLEPGNGGLVALAQGIAAHDQPDSAAKYLAIARLLAPGTLVEEAAFRREITLLLAQDKREQAIAHGTRYLWKFGKSAYAPDVIKYLSGSVLPKLAEGSKFERLQGFLGQLEVSTRQDVALDLGQAAVLDGRLDFASDAGASVLATNPARGTVQARAQVYKSLAQAMSKDASATQDELIAVDRRQLTDADRGIADAALMTAVLVRSVAKAEPAAPPDDQVPPIITRTRSVLSKADRILSENSGR